jgi:SAM-dependent methyltransferase
MPPSTDNVSQWGYNEEMLELIHAHRNGWVLDAGAGLKTVYYDNVVNLEIVDYPTTDVLSLGECLPFKTDVFDAALSVAVLEHVRDPFAYARELIRVLKPGGTLLAVAPFLQPLHGYPDHFYNMTSSGLRNLFEGPLIIEATRVAGHPIAALTWFLGAYLRGLPAPTAAAFERLSVAELVCNAEMLHAESFVRDLTPAACEELACANAIVARKPRA